MRSIIALIVLIAGLHEPAEECPPQLDCLAVAVFAEARGESLHGQVAVAEVVIERGEPCVEIARPGQFTALDRWPFPRDPASIDARAWRWARVAAYLAQERLIETECRGSTHFYAHAEVTPSWAGESCVIGNHTFTSPEAK